MKYFSIALSLFLVILLFNGCSKKDEPALKQAHLSGTITVDPEWDDSGDYSGIELLATLRDTPESPLDTVYHAITDIDGKFSGTATFQTRQIFPVLISRYGNPLGVVNMIFADGDSVYLESVLPDADKTTTITSYENDAYRTFERLQRNFNRVAMYINAGEIEPDNVEEELQKWSDLYWDLFLARSGTLASGSSASSSLNLLYGWNDELFESRLNEVIEHNPEIPFSIRRLGMRFYAEKGGVDTADQYFEKLNERNKDNSAYRMSIAMDRIELLFDSVRTAAAEELLSRFKRDYADNKQAMNWAENVQFDLEVLSPGRPFPSFEFMTTEGSAISSEDLENTPFILEIVRLDDPVYQGQYDRSTAIYQIYNMFGLQFITVPLSVNRTALDAFYEEHPKLWHVVEPGSFDQDELREKYNVNRLPTRFLVNENGNIIRRYIGPEFDDIVSGLQQILTEQETEE